MRTLWFALLAVMLISTVSPVQACSSSGIPWDSFLEDVGNDTDTIVVGSFVEQDNAGINGILKVATYLQGHGAEYITIAATDPRMLYNDKKVHRYYGCGTGYVRTGQVVEEGYYVYFLNKLDNGAYDPQYPTYYFETPESLVGVGYGDDGSVQLNLLGLQTQLLDALGTSPQLPNPDLPYPRTAPVLVTTTTGNHYMIPMDSNTPLLIPQEDLVDLQRTQHTCYAPCVAWSPNNLDKAYLAESEAEFEPITNYFNYNFKEHNVIGQRISFSGSSESYAVWADEVIRLYILWYPYLGFPPYVAQEGYTPEIFTEIPAQDSLNFPVAWSNDGFTLAFSTSEGLWLWDVYSADFAPQLILPTQNNVPTARYFSPLGRFLAVSEGDKHYTLDLVSKRQLPDGIVSPDDRRMLVYDTMSNKPTDYYVLRVLPYPQQQIQSQQPVARYFVHPKLWRGEWKDSNNFYAVITGDSYIEWVPMPPLPDGTPSYEMMRTLVERPFSSVQAFIVPEIPFPPDRVITKPHTLDFDYDENLGLLQLGVDRYWLRIGDKTLIYLRGLVDAPIAEIAWLPSVFYYD